MTDRTGVGTQPLWGAVEAGGTKMNCALAQAGSPGSPPQLLAQTRLATRSPEATLTEVIQFFQSQQRQRGPLHGLGLGCFGPIDLKPNSPTWGCLLDTPKPGWQGIDVAGVLGRSLGLPVCCETDVNAAALGEHRWGAAQGLEHFVYLTVGTGIGGGAMVHGKLLHGLLHPEMGHIAIPQNREKDSFAGCCPFHGGCLEGLASGTAIAQRWGQPCETLPPEHPAWALEADYLAEAIALLTFTLSPQRFILGGGVMAQQHLFAKIHKRVRAKLGSYLSVPEVLAHIEDYVVPPALGERSGILGAIALAQSAANQ